jgi:hypothetical protein
LFWACWNWHKTATFKELWWWSFSLQSHHRYITSWERVGILSK